MLRILSRVLLILVTLALPACGQAISPARGEGQSDAAATQAAHIVETVLARASFTPTAVIPPTETPAPATAHATVTPIRPDSSTLPAGAPTDSPAAAFKVTAEPGLELYTHPDIAEYVFQINPEQWEKDASGETANLINRKVANCRVEATPGRGLGTPQHLLWLDLGRFRWEVLDYGDYALATAAGGSFLTLPGFGRSACRAAQEDLLANIMTVQEARGEIAFALYRSPTPRPALEGFECPNTPPARIRVGDVVAVVTDALWLRSAPRGADESVKVRKYVRNAPANIRVIGGPVCEKFVYWQVDISSFGENAEAIQGWFAEGDPNEYYIKPVK